MMTIPSRTINTLFLKMRWKFFKTLLRFRRYFCYLRRFMTVDGEESTLKLIGGMDFE